MLPYWKYAGTLGPPAGVKIMVFKAKIILLDDYTRIWEAEGKAEKTLLDALEYLHKKTGNKKDSAYEKIINYLINDWTAFDIAMTKLFFKKKNEQKK